MLHKKGFWGDSGGLLQSLHFESSLWKKKRKVSWPFPHWVKTKPNGENSLGQRMPLRPISLKAAPLSQNLNILFQVASTQRERRTLPLWLLQPHHIVLTSSSGWKCRPVRSSYPPPSACAWIPWLTLFSAAAQPSLCVNIFPSLLILNAIFQQLQQAVLSSRCKSGLSDGSSSLGLP